MKTFKYKLTLILLFFAVIAQAQKFDKRVNESFKVNSDVTLKIDATQTDVEIETWNRNVVSIEAVMEVEGATKEEAAKILKNWNFEALGNKHKVEVISMSNHMNFNFDFEFPEIDIQFPHIEFPELKFAEFEFPEMPEMPEIPEIPEIEFDYQAYKKDSTYLKKYKLKVAKQVEKFKNSDWKKKIDSFRNSEEFKRNIEEYKKTSKEMAKEMKELRNSEEFKRAISDAKRAAAEVKKEMLENKELWRKQAEEAKHASKVALEIVEKMKKEGTLDSLQNYGKNVYFNYKATSNSKVKIKKYLKIKVPKRATFDLNVRHGKVTIPESNKKMSAHMSYSNFIGGVITGETNNLTFSNSPVSIVALNSSTITLKNVPKAKFGTFENVNLFSNSSDVILEEVGNDVSLSQKFGTIQVNNTAPNFNRLNIILDYATASLDLSNTSFLYQINSKKSNLEFDKVMLKSNKKVVDGVQILDGYSQDSESLNKLFLTAVFSSVNLKN